MQLESFVHNFTKKARESGYSDENIQKCLTYAAPLIEKGLPVIFNTTHFSQLVGYNKPFIKKAVLYPDYFYRVFTVQKKNGQLRELKEPLPSLKEIQCWILENILYEIPSSRYAKAYIKNRDLIDNVKYHKEKKQVITLDITNFFSSIRRTSIEAIFNNFGYSSNLSNLFSKLCCCNDILPQGAPTSPYLSNLFMRPFDNNLSSYCNDNKIRFTRYADDITISGEFDPAVIIDVVANELRDLNLSLNERKIKVMGRNVRQIVTGIVVNEKIQVPKSYRDFIKQEIYFINRFGLESHLQKTQNQKLNYLSHLLGKINFVLQINPKDLKMLKYKEFVYSLILP